MKKGGSLRICIDPQKLNESLKRCPHKIPTVDELNPLFGLNVTQDIFQARMDQILEGLAGVTGIADDVSVFGATEEEQ